MTREQWNIGGYRSTEVIGRGGFGTVFRAEDPDHGRQVAIKVLDVDLGEEQRRRFDRERLLMGQLSSHPNIISIFDSGYTEEGEAFIVMELASSGSLRDELARRGRYSWQDAVEVIATIAPAVAAAHERGIVHRDIKPDNILIDDYGNPRLTDFGIAALTGGATSTQAASATLAHAAPEVLEGRPSTEATDLYALGSTLYTLIAGVPPYLRADDEGLGVVMRRILAEDPPDLRPLGVPDALASLVERALAKNPDDRPGSATEFAADLRAVLTRPADVRAGVGIDPIHGTVAVAAPDVAAPNPLTPPPGIEPPRPSNRRTVFAVAAGAIAILLLAGIVIATRGGDDGETSADGTTTVAVESTTSTTVATTTTAAAPATIAIDCPTEIAMGEQVFCDITTGGVVSGTWDLPGFLDSAIPLGDLNGPSSIFIEPVDPSAAGVEFTITATALDAAGTEVSAEHRFTVLGPSVAITCPADIAAGTRVFCEITVERATEGTWDIPGFGSNVIENVPGSSQIFIEPNAGVVGQRFTASATVTDAFGVTATATAEFTVTAGA